MVPSPPKRPSVLAAKILNRQLNHFVELSDEVNATEIMEKKEDIR